MVQNKPELARSTDEEKQSQLKRLNEFHAAHADESPAMLKKLQQAGIENLNVFEVLMAAVRVCLLGQITNGLFEVGGQYRRNMLVLTTHIERQPVESVQLIAR